MRILIVEDEHKIANSIRKGLEQESYIVDVAYDGIQGYDIASSEPYDVIILDRMLPGMEGTILCSRLRANNIHTPILILTAKGQLEERVEGLNVGADDYLVKPFAFTELLARIRALSRRPQHMTDSSLSLEDLHVDTSNYEVTRAGKKIQLSNKEYALLTYLLRHKEKIIPKEQIIRQVWNYDADVLPNSVEVYIKHLRDKIDVPFHHSQQLIHTIRGFGYKIAAEK